MGSDERSRWAEQRRLALQAHAAADAQRRSSEVEQARQLVIEFAREATERGLRVVELLARPYTGRGTYRTGLRGWYLTMDHTIGIGTDGRYYLLTVRASVRARLTGAVIEAREPRLIVGEGARDGESMPLGTLLRLRLDAGDEWP